jgi:formylglycine-generating enzyme required for sulfatase activity
MTVSADRQLKGMVPVPRGTFRMGSDRFYPDEAPVRSVPVGAFWIEEHPVTVAQFRRFVKDTGHVTVAEQVPAARDYPGAESGALVPGALVFRMTAGPVDLSDFRQWWSHTPGADWRHPSGPGSTLNGRDLHPVTQVAYADAAAYAEWAGKQLPTESEWEYAARGGLNSQDYVWGAEFMPRGKVMANTWHGDFPWRHTTPKLSGRPGTTPVRSYPPNGYGLYDMAGNVWEWTSDVLAEPSAAGSCCAPPASAHQNAQTTGAQRFARHVIKGGSYLCAPNYCLRYRPAARQGQDVDTATCHLGFRCVVR